MVEVIRNGQGYSVVTPRIGDVVINPITNRGGGGRSSPSTSVSIRSNGNNSEVIINGQGYSVAQGQVETFLASKGLSGSSYQSALEQARRQDDVFRIQQAELRRQSEAERARIETLKRAIIAQGAQEKVQMLKNAEGQRIKTTNYIINKLDNGRLTKVNIWEYKNLDTGVIKLRTYEGSGGKLTGGLDIEQQSSSEANKIQNELKDSGLTPIINNEGQVMGFSSKVTGKSYAYNDGGFSAFSKDSGSPRTQILSAIGNQPLQKKKLSQKAIELATRLTLETDKIEERLTTANKNRELARLKELSNKRNLSTRELTEKRILIKRSAENYQLGAKYIVNTIAYSLINLGVGTTTLLNSLRKNPFKTISSLPGAIKQGLVTDFNRVISGNRIGIARVGLEWYTYGEATKLASSAVKGAYKSLAKLSPKYVKMINGKFILKKAGISLKAQTVKSGSMSFAKQFKKYGGKKITAVNASAEGLTKLLKRKNIIRKPFNLSGVAKKFPLGEKSFPKAIRRLLAKFDAGKKLTTSEFIFVNKWLRKNVAPNATLLERSLYLDPAGGLRLSRLGTKATAKATLRDVIRGKFRFEWRSNKPQVLIFENIKVAKAPKYIQKIVNKIDKRGIKYAGFDKDLAEIVKWQTQTGKRVLYPGGSPIYAGGRELEVTLSPGEMIKRIKQVGFTYIDGKKVTFVTAEVFKPSKALLKQINLANIGKLTKGAVSKLENSLSKSLGRRIRVETPSMAKTLTASARRIGVPVIRVRLGGLFVVPLRGLVRNITRFTPRVGRTISLRSIGKRIVPIRSSTIRRTAIPRPSAGRTTRQGIRPTPNRNINGRFVPGRINTRKRNANRRPSGRVGRTNIKNKITQAKIQTQDFRRQSLSSAVPTYYVKLKIKNRVVNLTPRPLTLTDARDFLAYRVDNGLSRSAWFEPIGKSKNVVSVPKNIKGYYNKVSNKLRPYKFRMGRKIGIRMGYIEKRRFFNDTPGERRDYRSTKQVARRRINPQQRRILLKRLKFAREVRMRNLRRRR